MGTTFRLDDLLGEDAYRSPIPAEREPEFQGWVQQHSITDLDHPDSHYDYRGAFLAGEQPDAQGHWTDRFKAPGHPTFSVESEYASGRPDAGRWEGEGRAAQFVPPPVPTAPQQATQRPSGDSAFLRAPQLYGYGEAPAVGKTKIVRLGAGYRVPLGTPINPVEPGTVELAGHLGTWGGTVIVNHGDHRTVYTNLDRVNVQKGDQVDSASEIGLSGGANSDEGPHVEFQVRDAKGHSLDPAKWLAQRGAQPVAAAAPPQQAATQAPPTFNLDDLLGDVTAKPSEPAERPSMADSYWDQTMAAPPPARQPTVAPTNLATAAIAQFAHGATPGGATKGQPEPVDVVDPKLLQQEVVPALPSMPTAGPIVVMAPPRGPITGADVMGGAEAAGTLAKEYGYMRGIGPLARGAVEIPGRLAAKIPGVSTVVEKAAEMIGDFAGRSTAASRVVGAAKSAVTGAAEATAFGVGREAAEGTPAEEIPSTLPGYAGAGGVFGTLLGALAARRISTSRAVSSPADVARMTTLEADAAKTMQRGKLTPEQAEDFALRTLGLQQGATEDEIKTAFRTQAVKFHPDKGTQPDAEVFKTFVAARDIARAAARARAPAATAPEQAPAEAPPAAEPVPSEPFKVDDLLSSEPPVRPAPAGAPDFRGFFGGGEGPKLGEKLVDSYWERVQAGKSPMIAGGGPTEDALQRAWKAGELRSRDDVARVVAEVASKTPRRGIRQRLADLLDPERAAQVEQLENERRSAQRAAETDALTGLGNRAAFDKASKSEESGQETETVAFDLNNLKAANDILGHENGNTLLRKAADAIQKAGGRGFRLGGDEFAAIVPKGMGETIRQRVEQAVGDVPVKLPDGRTVNASISGSVGPDYEAADAGLQSAKLARKGPAGSARGPAGDTPTIKAPAGIVRVRTADIIADPQRFQFKQLGTEGVTGELKGVTKYNEKLGGVLTLWRDPVDSKTYVVNGHNRFELAQRTGQPEVNAQFIDAPDAATARAEGAFINIAEGRGTATDVAKLFRDRKVTPEDLADRGVSIRGDLARDGLALSKLAPDIFDHVATGKVPQSWGIAIGSLLDDPVLQRDALAAARTGKRLSQAEVTEIARQVRDAGTEALSQESLFGTETERHSLFVQKAQLATTIKKNLAADKRLFGYVSKEGRAEQLGQAGETHIDVDAAQRIAEGSARAGEVFDRLYTRSGPLADLMNEGARRIAHGEQPGTVAGDLYPQIQQAVSAEIGGGGGAAQPELREREVPPAPRSVADEIAAEDEARAGRVADSTDEDQSGLFGVPEKPAGGPSGAKVPETAAPSPPASGRPSLDLTSEAEPAAPDQASMFGGKEGTAASRDLSAHERVAQTELEVLREKFKREKDPDRRQTLAQLIAEREKLVNRDKAITQEEMGTRAAAEAPVSQPTQPAKSKSAQPSEKASVEPLLGHASEPVKQPTGAGAPNLVQNPSGSWSFVGKVDARLSYVQKDGSPATPEQLDAARHAGPAVAGIKTRSWPTREAAEAALAEIGGGKTPAKGAPNDLAGKSGSELAKLYDQLEEAGNTEEANRVGDEIDSRMEAKRKSMGPPTRLPDQPARESGKYGGAGTIQELTSNVKALIDAERWQDAKTLLDPHLALIKGGTAFTKDGVPKIHPESEAAAQLQGFAKTIEKGLAAEAGGTSVAPNVESDHIPEEEEPGDEATGAVRKPAPRKPVGESAGGSAAPGQERPARGAPAGDRAGRAGDEGTDSEPVEGTEPGPESGVASDAGEAGRGSRPARSGAGTGRGNAESNAGRLHGLDYRITDADAIGSGGPKAKARANLEAIKLLKQIEAEGRQATAEEQAALVKYVGWGGLPGAFETSHADLGAIARELKDLLTPEEHEAARASTPNAHYTSVPVINAIYAALDRMGFRGGNLLEPSMGVGHFFGLMPTDMRGRSNLTGVELDSITGRIGRLLYPGADVRVTGFEKVRIPDGRIDVAVGNVPFGDYKVHDPKYNKLGFNIHNYFFAKALDTVRPGGVVAFITSRFTMDQGMRDVRKYLGDRADLVGAIRLPNTAFKGTAGTEVTTDIIFLRRLGAGEKPSAETWEAAVEQPGDWRLNEYFVRHPDMMLGTMKLEGTMYGGNEPTLVAPKGQDLVAELDKAVQRLPQDIYKERATGVAPGNAGPVEVAEGQREGTLADRGGRIQVVENGEWKNAGVPESAYPRVTKLLAIRDATRAVIRAQLADLSDEQLKPVQDALNRAYDGFVKKFGPINKEVHSGTRTTRPNLKYFEDVDTTLVMSLEHYDSETDTAKKAEIFTERVLRRPKPPAHVDLAADAVLLSLDAKGDVDFDYMGGLTGKSRSELLEELRGLVYEDPETGKHEPADAYLSGNVRTKLLQAKAAAKRDPRFKDHVAALEKVQPKDLLPSEIDAGLGASWVPIEDYEAFVTNLLGRASYGRPRISHFAKEASWSLDLPSDLKFSVKAQSEYGTDRAGAGDLIEAALNQKQVTIYDAQPDGTRVKNAAATLAAQEKLQRIKDEFKKWIFADTDRGGRLVRKYNDEINNIRNREFNGAHLTLPGASMAIKPHPHQVNSVYRVLQSGNTLLAHVVGAGKTYTMVMAGMEAKRLGMAQKPMYTVPNHMLGQFSREFLQMYPAAKVLVAKKEDFLGDRRKLFVAKSATGDWDAIVLTHSSFGKVGMSREFEEEYIRTRLAEYETAMDNAKAQRGNRSMVKQIEKGKKRLDARLAELLKREAKDDVLSFEELGVDMLFVDEAHLFKNLETPTKMERISLPASQRAQDLYLKTQYLDRINPGRGVVFATGTPISNSVAEMFTMQRYLQPRALAERDIEHFDAWAANFGDVVTALELKPEGGGFRVNTRFARFKNMGELSQLFRQVADVKTQDDLKLKVPKIRGGKPAVKTVPASDQLRSYIETLVKRADAVRRRRVEPHEDNMLKITGDGRKAALDMRLVDPLAADLPNNKLNIAAREIHRIWEEHKAKKSAQLVFSDLGTPNKEGRFDVYTDLKQKLIRLGIPEKEVAFIHDATSDEKKDQLFAAVRAGKIRVLIGSTEKMGAGTNVQRRLIAKHDLDAPWRPSDIEQRDGRIVRQGNENDEVEISRYVTEGSFDAYSWQILETKARFIDQAMRASADTRTIEDVDARELTFAEIKALASGDPRIMEKAGIDADVQKLLRLKDAHSDAVFQVKQRMVNLPGQIESLEALADRVESDLERREDTTGDKFAITIDGTKYTKRADAGERLKFLLMRVHQHGQVGQPEGWGKFGGLKLEGSSLGPGTADVDVALLGDAKHFTHIRADATAVGVVQSIEGILRRMESDLAHYRDRAQKAKGDLADARRLAEEPFEREAELQKKLARQTELEKELTPKEQPPEAAVPPEEGEEHGVGGSEAGFIIPELFQPTKIAAALYERMAESEVGDAVQRLLSPATRTTEAGTAAHIARHRLGELEHEYEVARVKLGEFRKDVPTLATNAGVDFVDAIEAGAPQAVRKLDPAARAIRVALDDARDEVQALGKLEQFNENYFPHIWRRNQGSWSQIFGRRPLEGSKAFLKQRSIPTVKEGIQAGLEPIVDNPVDMVLLKLREMRKYIAAHRILLDLKDEGLAKFVKAGTKAPDGWAKINDKIATVYGPPTAEGAMIIRGEYWAPEPVARILNNYLSPGLRGNPIYDAFMGLGNLLNQAQLGFSAFHFGFTSLDSGISRLGLAVLQAGESGFRLKAPVTAVSSVAAPLTNVLKGWKVWQEYRRPGTQGAEVAAIVEALVQAGGRTRMPDLYKNNAVERFLQALRRRPAQTLAKGAVGAAIGGAVGGPIGAAVGSGMLSGAMGAALELAAKPIMEYLVPFQKLGVFFDLARFELDRLPKTATPEDRRAVFARAWDSVDNRMGQVVYDNKFWNRTLKDLMHALVRSLGWNWGTASEVGGGIKDLSEGKLTPRATYVLSMVALVGLVGALITYLYTGEGPKELRDYFYPRTGRKNREGDDERLELPAYTKDVLALKRHPVQTIAHKLHPMISTIADMLANKDYYGTEIRSEHAPLVEQAREIAEYFGRQFIPFGVRGSQQEGEAGEKGITKYLPYIGITPAPREVVRSPAENITAEYLAKHRPVLRSREEAAAAEKRRDLESQLRSGEAKGSDLREQIRSGELTRQQAVRMIHEAHQDPSQIRFKQLPTEVAMQVYEAASPDERGEWYQAFLLKIHNEDDREVRAAARTMIQLLPHGTIRRSGIGRVARGLTGPPRIPGVP